MNKLIKDALILTLITLIAGVALGAVYEVTKEPIAAANLAAIQAAYRSLFPEAEDFEDDTSFDAESVTATVTDMLLEEGRNNFAAGDLDLVAHINAIDSDGNVMGDIVTVTTHKGYDGDITLSVGIAEDGTITGYQITDISETPGLGMKATEERFSSQFMDVPAQYYSVTKVTPASDEIQAISGATKTSRAVTNSVDAAVAFFNSMNGGGSDE